VANGRPRLRRAIAPRIQVHLAERIRAAMGGWSEPQLGAICVAVSPGRSAEVT